MMSRTARPRWWMGSAITAGAVVAAEVFAYLLPESAQPFQRAGFLLVLAAMVSAGWRGGLRGGAIAGAIGILGIAHLFLIFGAPLGPPPVRLFVGATIGAFGLGLASLIGYLRDREQRAVELLLREREAAAQGEGRRFGIGRLFAATGEAVIITNSAGRIVMWNPAAEAIFGYTNEEALGMNVRALVPARLAPRHDAGMERYRTTGRGAYIDSHEILTLPAKTKDGREIVVEMTLSRADDAFGSEGGPYALAILREVTDRVRLTHELEATNRALAEANKTLEAFTYVASHDLKEPVRGLETYAVALDEDHRACFEADPEARALVARLRRDAGRLRTLIEGLMDYSRAARIDPSDLEALHADEVLASPHCRARFENALLERGAKLKSEPGPPVLASAAGLSQVLGNLVLNAIKHHGGNGPEVALRSGIFSADPTQVEVVVVDNGVGFPPAILNAFSGKDDKPPTLGGGFGLVITRQAVQKMGGTLWLVNAPGGGGEAHFTLPLAPPGANRP